MWRRASRLELEVAIHLDQASARAGPEGIRLAPLERAEALIEHLDRTPGKLAARSELGHHLIRRDTAAAHADDDVAVLGHQRAQHAPHVGDETPVGIRAL